MGNLIADVFITIKPTPDRHEMTRRSVRSLLESSDRGQFRLTLCVDGPIDLEVFGWGADYVLSSRENEGLGPTINRAIAHIKSVNDWYAHPTHGDQSKVAPFVVMCQDDIQYTKDWLPILASRHRAYSLRHKIGFSTGHNAVEHPVRQDLGGGVLLKDWIRATQMLAERSYWESLMPIPRLDPETGAVRGKPNDGLGSGVDWWLIRNHENSVCRSGRTCLVIPGLVQHIGYDNSTWLKRDLPEDPSDLEKMK